MPSEGHGESCRVHGPSAPSLRLSQRRLSRVPPARPVVNRPHPHVAAVSRPCRLLPGTDAVSRARHVHLRPVPPRAWGPVTESSAAGTT